MGNSCTTGCKKNSSDRYDNSKKNNDNDTGVGIHDVSVEVDCVGGGDGGDVDDGDDDGDDDDDGGGYDNKKDRSDSIHDSCKNSGNNKC